MTFEEVKTIINSIGLPVAYFSFPEKEAPVLPYLIYFYPEMRPETADNTHHAQICSLILELYTETKDFDVESSVDTALLNAGFVFGKEETYLNDEKMYEVIYQMEVAING